MARATRSPTTSCSTPPEVALYAVRMDVELPQHLPGRDGLLAREKAYSQDLRRSGQWRHIWRITGMTTASSFRSETAVGRSVVLVASVSVVLMSVSSSVDVLTPRNLLPSPWFTPVSHPGRPTGSA